MHLELRGYPQKVIRELHPPVDGLKGLLGRARDQADTFPLLSGVDPHGVTPFQSFQCRRLATELAAVAVLDLADAEKQALDQVRQVVDLLAPGFGYFPDPEDLGVSFITFVADPVPPPGAAGDLSPTRQEGSSP